MDITSKLSQVATYWSPSGFGQFGQPTYNSSISLKVRKEEKNELFIDRLGQEQTSKAIYYSEIDVAIEGYIMLGSSTASDPTIVSGASEIRMFNKSPSLNAQQFLRKIIV